MPYLDRGDVRVYYEDDGAGLPILLTHGFGASTGMWAGQVAAYQDRYRLIRWDMRGHGKTECPEELSHYSQAHTVEDMRALLDHLGVEQAVIAGHSLGGFMALAFNVAYPERVKALVLQGSGPGYRRDEARETWNERTESRARTIEEGGLAALGGGAEVGESVQRSAKGLAQAARGILSQVDSRVIDSLPSISVPTLVVIGDGDTYYLDGSAYMAKRIPRAVNVVVSGAGHGVNVEKPEEVNEALGLFLGNI
jgi:pimeloyl-ACP methyl ester carboxylesterase